jgi:hypothetical protein
MTGLGMRNPLSPFVANVFMSFMERKLSSSKKLLRIWHRYVDDITVVIRKGSLLETLNINSYHSSIKFTSELDTHDALSFLELNIERDRKSEKINFKIYRKPNSTNNFINNRSFHCRQPIDMEDYNKERQIILDIGEQNGYKNVTVEGVISKQEK